MNSNANPTPNKSRPRKRGRRQLAIAALACLSVPAAILADTLTGDTLNVWDYSDQNSVPTGVGNGAFGYANTITSGAHSSVAIGWYNDINSSSLMSLVVGHLNGVQASGTVALGRNNYSVAPYSATIGRGLISDTEGCVVVGKYNNSTAYTGEAFVVGVGTNATTGVANGLVVLNNGDVIIPNVQGDISMGVYGD